ncbi:hypothetical protein KHA80_20325 [Anaerobacillus sp. HL2]|nr:hypothetical protein KHA80_20325 [Anaerobacillus sp. HL2]
MKLDVFTKFMTVSEENRYTSNLTFNQMRHIAIVEGRHPVVEKDKFWRVVSNDVIK